MRQLQLIWDLARKDWKLFLADRRAAALCFVVPILLASVFGMIFDRPGRTSESPRLSAILVAGDDSDSTRQLLEMLSDSGGFESRVSDRETATRTLAARDVSVVLVCTSDSKNRPSVEVLHHPSGASEARWAEGIVAEILAKDQARKLFGPLYDAASMKPFHIERRPLETTRAFNSYSHSFSGMTLQYLLFWGLESGLVFLRERQRGLWRRIRVAPVPLTTALLGRALATSTIALLQLGATFLFGWVAFGVTVNGSWLAFGLLAGGIAILSAATGLCVAAVGGTEARARSIFVVAILGLSMLGGLWLPSFLLPKWVQDLSNALPTTWAMHGLDGLTNRDLGFVDSLPNLLAVLSFAVAFLGLALLRFRWFESQCRRGVLS
jgi:ABC-2 type transport system permease protein